MKWVKCGWSLVSGSFYGVNLHQIGEKKIPIKFIMFLNGVYTPLLNMLTCRSFLALEFDRGDKKWLSFFYKNMSLKRDLFQLQFWVHYLFQ